MAKKVQYLATVYLRLSKEDDDISYGNKAESNSISNQKELIMKFVESQQDIQVIQVRTDDGYTGVDFNRPQFQLMMEDIRNGRTNCIIVKDLSRFGRNYIEVGRYLERIFPSLGIRFIAVNDNYDSKNISASDDITIPFKNLLNDSYCRDISIKIRSHLKVKREKGEFVGAFSCYGYLKSEENKNKLVIDPYAAAVVRDIFSMKMNGMGQNAIADYLNRQGILSPFEYKKSLGLHYETSFKTSLQAKWTNVSVTRILKNEIYTGVLIQGKQTTPNHKIHTRARVAESEQIRVENAHEPIIDRFYFDIVQKLLERDTRTSPKEDTVHLLCGLIFCGDCGAPMRRKVVPKRNEKCGSQKSYCYYVCKQSEQDKCCTAHRIREDILLEAVTHALRAQIEVMLDKEKAITDIEKHGLNQNVAQKYEQRLEKEEDELMKYTMLKCSIYEDYKGGLLDRKYFQSLNAAYTERINNLEKTIAGLRKNVSDAKKGTNTPHWFQVFREYETFSELTRAAVVTMIDRILIYEDGRIQIIYRFGQNFVRTSLPDVRKEAL